MRHHRMVKVGLAVVLVGTLWVVVSLWPSGRETRPMAQPSPSSFRVVPLNDMPLSDELSRMAIGTGQAGKIASSSPGHVLVGVYHGDCDRFTVDATHPGDLVVTITTDVPKGTFCTAAGRISGLEVEVPSEAGPYTLILRQHRQQ